MRDACVLLRHLPLWKLGDCGYRSPQGWKDIDGVAAVLRSSKYMFKSISRTYIFAITAHLPTKFAESTSSLHTERTII